VSVKTFYLKEVNNNKYRTESSCFLFQLTFSIGSRISIVSSLHLLALYLQANERTLISFTQVQRKQKNKSQSKVVMKNGMKLNKQISIVIGKSQDYFQQKLSKKKSKPVRVAFILKLLHKSATINPSFSCKNLKLFLSCLLTLSGLVHQTKLNLSLGSLMAAQLKLIL